MGTGRGCHAAGGARAARGVDEDIIARASVDEGVAPVDGGVLRAAVSA